MRSCTQLELRIIRITNSNPVRNLPLCLNPFSQLQQNTIELFSRLVMSDSLKPCGLQPTRLLHPWDIPGKSTGVGCHCLLRDFMQRITKISQFNVSSTDNCLIFIISKDTQENRNTLEKMEDTRLILNSINFRAKFTI